MSNQARFNTSAGSSIACCRPLSAASLTPEQAEDLSRMFKALGDPVRLRLLSLITSADREVCVCDLTSAIGLTGPTISHHLKVLREAGLVVADRRGTWVHYSSRPEQLTRLAALLECPAEPPSATR